MNILFCYDLPFILENGGVARVSRVLAEEFRKRGHCCFFFSLKKSQISEDFSIEQDSVSFDEKVKILAELIARLNITHVVNQSGSYGERGGMLQLIHSATRECADVKIISVIHSSMFDSYKHAYVTYYPRLKNKHLSVFACLLAIPFASRLITKYAQYKSKPYYKKLCEWSDKVVVLASKYKKEYESLLNENLQNVFVIPNPVTIESVPSDVKENLVVYVGRLVNTHKQVNKLINIWNKVEKLTDWELHLVGDGPDRDAIKRQVEKFGLNRVKFLGHCDPLSEYSKAAIICQTSSFEGWSLVLAEAMINKCVPMAFGSYGAVGDIIDSGENGVVIKPFDEKSFSQELLILINNKELREKYAISAYNKAQKWTTESIVDQWLNIMI